jgi:lysyl-tRNA synthetase class 2
LQLALGILPIKTLTYEEAFNKACRLNYNTCSAQDLITCLQLQKIEVSDTWDKDFLIQIVMSSIVEPSFDPDCLTIITDFPAEQAALAKTKIIDQKQIACRFEIYYKTIELANGYQELTDPQENLLRIKRANQARISKGKEPLPIDNNFIQDLQKIPPCSGVALGFDRLLAVKHGLPTLQPILSFSWNET